MDWNVKLSIYLLRVCPLEEPNVFSPKHGFWLDSLWKLNVCHWQMGLSLSFSHSLFPLHICFLMIRRLKRYANIISSLKKNIVKTWLWLWCDAFQTLENTALAIKIVPPHHMPPPWLPLGQAGSRSWTEILEWGGQGNATLLSIIRNKCIDFQKEGHGIKEFHLGRGKWFL